VTWKHLNLRKSEDHNFEKDFCALEASKA